jgi:hypothetical protein
MQQQQHKNRAQFCPHYYWAALGMAETATVETRLRAILDAARNRRRIAFATAAAGLVLALLALLPLAMLRPGVAAAAPPAVSSTSAAEAKAQHTACLNNLKQLGMSVMMYAQDYDETLPPLGSPQQFRNRVMPYVRNRNAFVCPATNQPYIPVAALSSTRYAALRDPASTMILHDAAPHSIPGSRLVYRVVYADGHAKTVASLPAVPRPAPRLEQRLRAQASYRAQRADLVQRLRGVEQELAIARRDRRNDKGLIQALERLRADLRTRLQRR